MNKFIEVVTLEGRVIVKLDDLYFQYQEKGGEYYICDEQVSPDEYSRVRGVLESIGELINKDRVFKEGRIGF